MRFVVWIWKGNRNYQPEHVNHLYRQLERLCPDRFSLVAVSDETKGFLPGVEVVKTPPAAAAVAKLRTVERPTFPSCFQRLWMFSQEAVMLGERVMLIDVDLVFTRDPAPLFDRTEDFVGWRPLRTWGRENRFGGGVYLLRTGTRTHVWDSFKGPQSIACAQQAGFRGSDQAWLSYCLSSSEASWPMNSGIYSVRDLTHGEHQDRRTGKRMLVARPKPLGLPDDAIMVHFNGPDKPWSMHTKLRHTWLKSHCA